MRTLLTAALLLLLAFPVAVNARDQGPVVFCRYHTYPPAGNSRTHLPIVVRTCKVYS